MNQSSRLFKLLLVLLVACWGFAQAQVPTFLNKPYLEKLDILKGLLNSPERSDRTNLIYELLSSDPQNKSTLVRDLFERNSIEEESMSHLLLIAYEQSDFEILSSFKEAGFHFLAKREGLAVACEILVRIQNEDDDMSVDLERLQKLEKLLSENEKNESCGKTSLGAELQSHLGQTLDIENETSVDYQNIVGQYVLVKNFVVEHKKRFFKIQLEQSQTCSSTVGEEFFKVRSYNYIVSAVKKPVYLNAQYQWHQSGVLVDHLRGENSNECHQLLRIAEMSLNQIREQKLISIDQLQSY